MLLLLNQKSIGELTDRRLPTYIHDWPALSHPNHIRHTALSLPKHTKCAYENLENRANERILRF